MRDEHAIEVLIPWYATGVLDEADRVRVEQHLRERPEAWELVQQARAQMTHALGDEHREHVHARLLTEYAENPASLEPETRAWVEQRVAECPSCREALEILRDLTPRLESTESAVVEQGALEHVLERLWAFLRSTVLRPAPALAYLVLLALLVPALVRRDGGAQLQDPAPAVPATVRLTRETVSRGTEPGSGAPPAVIRVAEPGAPILIELETELAPGDLLDADLSVDVELLREGRSLWRAARAGSDFTLSDGRAVLPVILHAPRLDRGATHELRLVARKPGTPLDGQVLFRRTFRFEEGEP